MDIIDQLYNSHVSAATLDALDNATRYPAFLLPITRTIVPWSDTHQFLGNPCLAL